MREILFRGKRLDTGEWVEGNLITGTHWLDKNEIAAIVPLDNTFYPRCEITCWFEVDPSTVGQYTELTDTYCNKIYEGDIVLGCDFDDVDGYGVVEWNDGAFEINNKKVSSTFHDNHWGYEFKVIGNIHDDPELLEE